ncbi:MAG TPA: hypothetical protein VHV78_01325 [Gemmatimonadaceae bacterium]|jgi:hypothetical protein|nr:hypothetical protein [Gemmatimonadaceae bacterium]
MKKRSIASAVVGVVGVVAAIAGLSCNWGTRPRDFPPALGPAGANAAVRIKGETNDRRGELIAVDSVGVTIRGDRTVRIPWTLVDAVDVANMPDESAIHPGEHVTPAKRAQLALYARFPQGIAGLPISLDSLVLDVQRATSRFADRRVAVAEGYIRVGADFPGMGEHWVNGSLLFAGTLDPARPTLLTYATIAGTPTLLGAGFILVTHGDSAPAGAIGWPHAWHEHSGLLDDESAAFNHESAVGSTTAQGTHVWIMHVWTALANPDGVVAADNWSLPYARAGLAIPRSHPADIDASRALSLTVGGDEFLESLLTDAGLRSARNAAAVDSLIAAARQRARHAALDSTMVDAHARDARLHDAWRALAANLERLLGPGADAVLANSHDGAHR